MLWNLEVLFSCLRLLNTPNKRFQKYTTLLYVLVLCLIFSNELDVLVNILMYIFSLYPYMVLALSLQLFVIPNVSRRRAIVFELLLLWARFFASPTKHHISQYVKYYQCISGVNTMFVTLRQNMSAFLNQKCMWTTMNVALRRKNIFEMRFYLTLALTILVLIVYNPRRSDTVFKQFNTRLIG